VPSVSLYAPEYLALRTLAKAHDCEAVTDFITKIVDCGVPTGNEVWTRSSERQQGTVSVKDSDHEELKALAAAHGFSVPDLLRDVIAGNWSFDGPPRERRKTWAVLRADKTWRSFTGTRSEAEKQEHAVAILALPG
jgi:hypothetical protein